MTAFRFTCACIGIIETKAMESKTAMTAIWNFLFIYDTIGFVVARENKSIFHVDDRTKYNAVTQNEGFTAAVTCDLKHNDYNRKADNVATETNYEPPLFASEMSQHSDLIRGINTMPRKLLLLSLEAKHYARWGRSALNGNT